MKYKIFLDTCVFIAGINKEEHTKDALASTLQFFDEASRGECRIYTSTIALAEFRPKNIVDKEFEGFSKFLSALDSCVLVPPDPLIANLASELRELDFKKSGSNKRVLTLGDSLMLATAIILEDYWQIDFSGFFTFDKGRGKTAENDKGGNKAIPLIGFGEWLKHCPEEPHVERVRQLNPRVPSHPNPVIF